MKDCYLNKQYQLRQIKEQPLVSKRRQQKFING